MAVYMLVFLMFFHRSAAVTSSADALSLFDNKIDAYALILSPSFMLLSMHNNWSFYLYIPGRLKRCHNLYQALILLIIRRILICALSGLSSIYFAKIMVFKM